MLRRESSIFVELGEILEQQTETWGYWEDSFAHVGRDPVEQSPQWAPAPGHGPGMGSGLAQYHHSTCRRATDGEKGQNRKSSSDTWVCSCTPNKADGCNTGTQCRVKSEAARWNPLNRFSLRRPIRCGICSSCALQNASPLPNTNSTVPQYRRYGDWTHLTGVFQGIAGVNPPDVSLDRNSMASASS